MWNLVDPTTHNPLWFERPNLGLSISNARILTEYKYFKDFIFANVVTTKKFHRLQKTNPENICMVILYTLWYNHVQRDILNTRDDLILATFYQYIKDVT